MIELPTDLREQIQKEIPPLDGWTTPERAFEMAQLIIENQCQKCCEIGVFGGRGLIAVALTLKYINGGCVVGIDPWRNEPCLEGENEANREWWSKVDLSEVHQKVMDAIWTLGLEKNAVVVRSCSQDVVHLFDNWDYVAIDGNHSEIASCRDVELYGPRIKKGGIIYFDDSSWPSTQKAISILGEFCDEIVSGENHKVFKKII